MDQVSQEDRRIVGEEFIKYTFGIQQRSSNDPLYFFKPEEMDTYEKRQQAIESSLNILLRTDYRRDKLPEYSALACIEHEARRLRGKNKRKFDQC